MDPQPSTLWTLVRGNHELACQVRLEPQGIEVDLLRGGMVVLTRTFETDQEALSWARAKRQAREAEGWTPVSPRSPERSRLP